MVEEYRKNNILPIIFKIKKIVMLGSIIGDTPWGFNKFGETRY